MTKPTASEVINVKNGHFRRLETGMVLDSSKLDLLGSLSSQTLVSTLKVMVEERANAHHKPQTDAAEAK